MNKTISSSLLFLMLQASLGAHAERLTIATSAGTDFVDLTATELQRQKNLLDCALHLEGTSPSYKLVYSAGKIPVPDAAVLRTSEQSAVIRVKASISGMPVEEIGVRYRPLSAQVVSCRKGFKTCVAPVAYELVIRESEVRAFQTLHAKYKKNRVFSGALNPESEANPGAIMITDRQNLTTTAMDGLSGSSEPTKTILHYVCGTTTEYWQ